MGKEIVLHPEAENAFAVLAQVQELSFGNGSVVTDLPGSLRSCLEQKVSELFPSHIVTLKPDQHIFTAYLRLEEEATAAALVQETKDTILGVVSHATLHNLISGGTAETRGENPVVSSVMVRNISIESDQATLLDVIERITVGNCPFVVIIDTTGTPSLILDAATVRSAIPLSEEELEHAPEVKQPTIVRRRADV